MYVCVVRAACIVRQYTLTLKFKTLSLTDLTRYNSLSQLNDELHDNDNDNDVKQVYADRR